MGKKFTELNVSERLTSELKRHGIVTATPVQEASIPVIRGGADVVVQAQTGTGKTLAYLLPIVEKVKAHAPAVQALVVAPTRELALQITKVAQIYGAPLGVRAVTIYGGQDLERQARKLGGNPQIVVGTPGRILDHLRRKTVDLVSVNKVVLDEADEMLHRGFIDDVEEILKRTAADRQTMFFSATIPDRIRALTMRYTHEPKHIKLESDTVTLENIKQIAIQTTEDAKLDRLCALINEDRPYLAMVFCHTKQRVSKVTEELARRGYMVDELHGDLSQSQRNLVMRRFAQAELQILVATDIAARGLDVEGVTHVFNYDVPHDVTAYIHRIGRTGRAGQEGKAITFVNARQQEYLRMIEHGIRAEISKEKAGQKKERPRRLAEKPADAKGKAKEKPRTAQPKNGARKPALRSGKPRGRKAANSSAKAAQTRRGSRGRS